MEYKILKMNFLTGVHFGDGNLQKSKNTLCADTIFSALCQEALKMGSETLEELVALFKNGKLCISDGLPFIGDTYYIPKPLLHIESDKQGDSVLKKALKKLEYIPVSELSDYLSGTMDILKAAEQWKNFGCRELQVKASINYLEETRPYDVGVFYYGADSGLYLCVGYEDENDFYLFSDLLDALSYVGIGGKISSGLGKFRITMGKIPSEMEQRFQMEKFKTFLTLSGSLPTDTELEDALDGANYLLNKRSGFISSSAGINSSKKEDLYLLAAGAVVAHRYHGDIYNVAKHWMHPVYCYAKPLFLGVM